MESGAMARFEEITRCASEVQDAMISHALGEADLGAGTGDRGAGPEGLLDHRHRQHPRPRRERHVGGAQAAVQHCRAADAQGRSRRRSTSSASECASWRNLDLRRRGPPADDAIEKVVTIFRELRNGQTLDGKNKLKTPSGVLSTAEAISVLANSMALAGNFGTGKVAPDDWPPVCKGRSSRTKRKTASCGRST
jgi:hypothetical protein